MSINQGQGAIGPKMKVVWSLCAVLVTGLRYPKDALYAKQLTLDKFRFSKLNPRPQVLQELGHQRKVLSPGGKFEFLLVSNYGQDKVTDFVTVLQVAGGFIENAITLQHKVVIKVCYSQNCTQFGIFGGVPDHLGNCFPKASVEYMPDGEHVVYPYALLNQKRNRRNEVDMQITMQHRDDFVMPVDFGGHGKNMIYDSVEVFIHEILHGMAFYSVMDIKIIGSHSSYIGPRFQPKYNYNNSSVQFEKTVFDMHLSSKGQSLHDILRSMTLKDASYTEVDWFLKNIPNMPQIKKIKEFVVGKEPVFFNTASNKAVYIQKREGQGPSPSSLSHLSYSYYTTSLDHLMIPSAVPYAFVIRNKTLVQFWKTAPLGPNIVDILATLGYTKNPNPNREKSQLAFYEEMRKHNSLKFVVAHYYSPGRQ